MYILYLDLKVKPEDVFRVRVLQLTLVGAAMKHKEMSTP